MDPEVLFESPALVVPRMDATMIAMAIDFTLSAELEDIRLRVRTFVDEVVRPGEAKIGDSERMDRKEYLALLFGMRQAAKDAGLWLPQMPTEWGGMGLGHVELAMVQAEAAKASYGPFVLNCQAPDEGNMHTLLHWATPEQKEKYLRPLCDGRQMSCFAMTEPEVAGSDPTLIRTTAVQDGDEWVVNGHKWFISNARRASFAILLARTEDNPDLPQAANTAFIVDIPSPGWNRVREVETMHGGTGHSEIVIEDLRVPNVNMLGGRGQGHLLGQYRLGPARLAHCMRWIAQAETALDMMVDRSLYRYSHGSVLAEKQGIQWMIADSTMELYQAKLMVLHAAYRIDQRPRLQVGGVDGQTLRGQHARPGDRPLDPGARRTRLLDRHTTRQHVSTCPLGSLCRRRRRGAPDADCPARHRRLPRSRLDAYCHRRLAALTSGHRGQPSRPVMVTGLSPAVVSSSRIWGSASIVSRWPKCKLTMAPGCNPCLTRATTAAAPGSVKSRESTS